MSVPSPVELIQSHLHRITYTVFPGVTLTYNIVSAPDELPQEALAENVMEISYCRAGRVECARGNRLAYMVPGDITILCGARDSGAAVYPSGYHEGVAVRLNIPETSLSLTRLLDDVNVHPAQLMQKFRAAGSAHFIRNNPRIAHIFEELYDVPEEIRPGYFKVKILELLLFLNVLKVEPRTETPLLISQTQAALAKAVCRYLTDHMDRHVTLEQLAEHFHVSGTGIKNSFKAVYGMSVYAYIRTQKMQEAARLLRDTDRSVLDIAGSFGYDNGSKFAKAFRDCCGMSPNAFRRNGGKCPNGAENVESL